MAGGDNRRPSLGFGALDKVAKRHAWLLFRRTVPVRIPLERNAGEAPPQSAVGTTAARVRRIPASVSRETAIERSQEANGSGREMREMALSADGTSLALAVVTGETEGLPPVGLPPSKARRLALAGRSI
jgi:hypothetical protein